VSLDLANSRDLLRALLPELALTLAGMVLLLVIAWRHRTAADVRLAGGSRWPVSRPQERRRGGCGGTRRVRSAPRP